MNLALKSVVLIGSAGGVTGSGILIHRLNKDERVTIRNLISRSKTKIFLTADEDVSKWKKAWNAYRVNDQWDLGNKNLQEVPQEFKNKCISLLGEKVSGESDSAYSNFLLYCSRDKTVEDILKEQGYSLASQNGNDSFWQSKFDEYKASADDKKIPNIRIGRDENHAVSGSLDKLKTGCIDAFNKPVTDSGYMSVLENIKTWCTSRVKIAE